MRKKSCIKVKSRKNKPRLKKELNILIKQAYYKCCRVQKKKYYFINNIF